MTVRWPRGGETKEAVQPIAELRELFLTGMLDGEDEMAWLADSPQLATLRRLTVRGMWTDTVRTLVASPHLAGLRTLRLPSNNLGNAGIQALTMAASLRALEELDLSALGEHERYNHDPVIRSAGMSMLVGWSGLAGVRSLTLSRNDVTRDGLRALLRSPHAAALKELHLRGTRLDGQMMEEFRSAVPELRLETLDLGENVLKELGAEYLAMAACLRELKALRLDRCEVPLGGARKLAKKAAFLDGLRHAGRRPQPLRPGRTGCPAGASDAIAPHALHARQRPFRQGGSSSGRVTGVRHSARSRPEPEQSWGRRGAGPGRVGTPARTARAASAGQSDHQAGRNDPRGVPPGPTPGSFGVRGAAVRPTFKRRG